jgi:leader peptidase (prepilin peptidase) / N-methyltransferase
MLGVIITFLYGVIFGSFINAVVWRIHSGRRIAKGRSMCPECKHELSVLDLVPIVSWMWLRGRCRYCHKPISIQYPIVELLTGIVFALSYAAMQPHMLVGWMAFVFWLYFVVVLIILSVYDLRWLLLPDKVMLPAIGVAGAMIIILGVMSGGWQSALSAAVAALAAGGAFYAIAAVSGGKWLGGGDIKLVFLMGLLLGLGKMGLAMLIAFNSAALIGVILILTKVKGRRDYIPFGPFLVFGTVIAMLYGDAIIGWYLSLSGVL